MLFVPTVLPSCWVCCFFAVSYSFMRHFSQVVIVESQLQSGTQDDAKQALSLAIQTSKKLIPTIERTSAPRCSMNAAVSSHRIFAISCSLALSHSIFRLA